MSERLTHSYQCGGYWASILKVSSCGEGECKGEIIDKLAHYEDINPNPKEILATIESMSAKLMRYQRLAEQGRLLELPCAVGDMVFVVIHDDVVGKRYIVAYEVCDVSTKKIMYADDWCDLNDLGKSVFLSREDAEEAMEEITK